MKPVRLVNVELRVRAHPECEIKERIREAWAILKPWLDRMILVNGEMPEREFFRSLGTEIKELRNASIELLMGSVALLYFPDRRKICIAFSDGEIAYMPCMRLDEIIELLKASGAKVVVET